MPLILVIKSPFECVEIPVPIQNLRTKNTFSLPNPTESILIISLLIFIKSLPKNEVIPETLIVLFDIETLAAKVVVIDVETIGDCMILSILTITLEF